MTVSSYPVLLLSRLVGHDPLSVALIDDTKREVEDDEAEPAAPGSCLTSISQRYVLAVLLHTGLAVCYAMRVSMSVAAAPPAALHDNATILINATMFTQYHWSNTDEGIVLGSFFQGYILTQTISAVLARSVGGKAVLAASMATGCALTWATPIVAGRLAEIVSCRTLLGIVQGAAYPATLTLVAKWYTPSERASFLGFIIAGPYLGEALTFPLAALVMGTSSLAWPFVFYFAAMIGAVWLILFLCLASSSPEAHPRISHAEQAMLRRALTPQVSKTRSRRCVTCEKPAAWPENVDARGARGQQRCLLEKEEVEEEGGATAAVAGAVAGLSHDASTGLLREASVVHHAHSDRGVSLLHETSVADGGGDSGPKPPNLNLNQRLRRVHEASVADVGFGLKHEASVADVGGDSGPALMRNHRVACNTPDTSVTAAGTRVDDSPARQDPQRAVPQGRLRWVDYAADIAGATRRGGEPGGSMVVSADGAGEETMAGGAGDEAMAGSDVERGRSGGVAVVHLAGDWESEDSVGGASKGLRVDGEAGGAAQWERRAAAASDAGIPWGAILECNAAWACWIGHTAESWNFYTLLTQLPSMLSLLLHLDGEDAGMIMSMCYLLMLASSVLSGIAADCILATNRVSACVVRKAAEVISVLVPSVLLFGASQALTDSAAVVLLIAAITCMGCCSAGHHTNYLEISTSLSGILMGIGNTITCLCGIAGPIVTGALVDVFGCTQQAPEKCRAAYGAVNLIGVGVSATGTLVFVVWGSSKRVLDY